MLRRLRQGRTTTIAAFLAGCLIATAATATAATVITSKQIKDGTISQKDLSKAVRSQLAKAGTPGLQGPKGDAGPAGATSGLTGVEKVDAQSAYDLSSGFKSAAASCPAGKKVIGGGGKVEGVTGGYMRTNGPSDDLTKWITSGYSSAGGAWQVTAQAICAPAS